MKVLITGFPGVGKSAVAAELKHRGHNAYEPEAMHAYTHVTDRLTGKHIHPPMNIPRGWFDTIGAQTWDIIKLQHLLNGPSDQYICGFTHNLPELYELFDRVFVLTLDDVELEQRLTNRRGDRIGKDADELTDIMLLHRNYEQSLITRGAIAINANQGTPQIVDKILASVQVAQ